MGKKEHTILILSEFVIFRGLQEKNINDTKKRDFMNGYERNIILDFNVDGPIYDLI